MSASPDAQHDDRDVRSGAADELVIRTAFSDGTFVIALYGEIDMANADEVDGALLRAESTGATEIVLDLSGLRFIDSMGLHLLVRADARSRANGRRLALLRGTGPVQRAVELSGLADKLPFVG